MYPSVENHPVSSFLHTIYMSFPDHAYVSVWRAGAEHLKPCTVLQPKTLPNAFEPVPDGHFSHNAASPQKVSVFVRYEQTVLTLLLNYESRCCDHHAQVKIG